MELSALAKGEVVLVQNSPTKLVGREGGYRRYETTLLKAKISHIVSVLTPEFEDAAILEAAVKLGKEPVDVVLSK